MSRFLHLAVFLVVVCSVAATVLPQPGKGPRMSRPRQSSKSNERPESCNGPRRPPKSCEVPKPTPKPCDDPKPTPPPVPKCKNANEIYILAKTDEATCDNLSPKACAPVKECRCRDGYVRNNGICIKPCDCPVKCRDPNEEYVLAKTGEATCDNPNPFACVPVSECRCKSGYVRERGICIKPKYCPIKCNDINEEVVLAKFSEPSCDEPTTKEITPVEECRCRSGFSRYNGKCILTSSCPSKCSSIFEEYILANVSEPTCSAPTPIAITPIKECRCIQGYVRNNGTCILPISCPCSGPNEMYITAIFSERTCTDQVPRVITPVSGCHCMGAYVRENGKCILPSDCPVICDDPNEEYINAIFSEMTCNDQVQRSIAPVKQCRCKPGFLRDGGKCVLPSTCPVVCPDPMEEYVQVSLSEVSCANPRQIPIQPTKECRCRTGFVRNNGKCILPMLCPCSNVNEEYMTTVLTEPTCADNMPRIGAETIGCRCKVGFVRDAGKCIPPCECPPICLDNEEYVTSLFNEPSCNDTVLRPIAPTKECRCKFGFVRNNGKCITQNECPVLCPDPNEEYVITQYSEPSCTLTVPTLIVTVQECRCKNGYVRDNGKCILPNTCPVICADPNEEYVTCLFSEASCSDRVPRSITPTQECRCKPGYLRDNYKCVLIAECPVVCSDSNAEYVMSQLSEPTCSDPNPTAIAPVKECRCKVGYVKYEGKCILPTDCPVVCQDPFEENVLTYYSEPTCVNQVPSYMTVPVKECRCKTGYVRENGKCILPSTCPVVCNDPFEEYIITLFSEVSCSENIPKFLNAPVQECRCKSGYVRNNDAKCILPALCPVICIDPFEEFILTSYSEPTCAEMMPKSLPSPVQECRCKIGYVKNDGKCILPSACPVVCSDPNEEYILATVGELTCDNQSPDPCSPVNECRCRNGFVRYNGRCIQPCDCPARCSDPNEEYITTMYGERTCEDPNPSTCSTVTECRCKMGLFRSNGKCIMPCDCPCGDNEVYSLESPIEPESCSNLGKPRSPLTKPGCMCANDMVRDCMNKCIPKCNCEYNPYGSR